MLYILFCFVSFFPLICTISLGIDHSNPISIDQFKCLLTQNHTFAYIRAWRSFGAFDNNAPQTLSNAIAAGFKQKDIGVYVFPCFSTSPEKAPELQIKEMIQKLGNAPYGSIWIDMQTNPSANCGWSKNFIQNCQFTQRLVSAARKSNKIVGVYASLHMWNQIMSGTDKCPFFVDLPLWYAHYDGILNFSDYKQFGGWAKPQIKQYKGTSTLCEINGLDLNFKA